MITDGLPDDKPSVILRNLMGVMKGRHIHCFYISGSVNDSSAVEFLRILAEKTGGSLHLLDHDRDGKIKEFEGLSIIDSDVALLSSADSRQVWFKKENKHNGSSKGNDEGWYLISISYMK